MRKLIFTVIPFVSALIQVNGMTIQAGPGETLKTPEDVRLFIRAERNAGRIHEGEKVVVELQSGDYQLEGGFSLAAPDSGSTNAPVVWRARAGGRVRFVGGKRMPQKAFSQVTGNDGLNGMQEMVRDKVLVADVSSLLPGRVEELAPVWFGVHEAPLLFVGGKPMTLARWPNRGWTSFTNATDHGRKPQLHAGAFSYDNPRVTRWDFARGVWFNGYWTHDWDNRSVRAASYDAATHEVRLAAAVPYGLANFPWGHKHRRFFAFNLLEELDDPGEWYLDRRRKRLYLYPPDTAEWKSGSVDVFLTPRNKPILKLDAGTRHVVFEGITFSHSYSTLVIAKGVDDVVFRDCTFTSGANGGLDIKGNNCEIRGCEFSFLGSFGAMLDGGDRRTLTHSNNEFVDNDIHDFAIMQRVYAPGVGVSGCGNNIRRNRIHDAPHCAVLYGGNDNLFEFNDVHHVLMETGDAGAFYTGRDWTTMGNVLRYNFVHELGAGQYGYKDDTMGFYFDDCDCGNEVYGNIFWRVSRGIMVGGGRENPIRNNVFAECNTGMSIDSRGMTWKQWNKDVGNWWLEGKAEALHYKEEPWRSRYPRLANIMNDSPREPLYNPVETNVFIDCRRQIVELDGMIYKKVLPKMVFAGNVCLRTKGGEGLAAPDGRIPGFTTLIGSPEKPIDLGFRDLAHGDFTLVSKESLLRAIPGFRPIPVFMSRTAK